MLNIRGSTFEVFAADVQLAKGSVDPEIARFFSDNVTGVGNKEMDKARNEVAKASPTARVVSNTPNCKDCGGTTHAKEITLKSGKQQTVYECNQDNGECFKPGTTYPTATWGFGQQKGRDS
jgi:outer membrane usher protein FimD/PapC